LSGTTRVSRYQKGKINLDFTKARDSEWQWHQLGHMQVCTSVQITTPAPHHSVFYMPDALPATQPTVSKHWRARLVETVRKKQRETERKRDWLSLRQSQFRQLGDTATDFLRDRGQRIKRVSAEPQSFMFLVQRLSVAVQRGNAVCISGTFGDIRDNDVT